MKRPSILITDDERNIRMLLQTTLDAEGYDLTEAANGIEAMEAIHRSMPDLLLLDLNMPGMDGMAVLEQLAAITPERRPRVIVLTAHGSIPTAVKATRLGAIDFLEKPLMPEELREAVKSALAHPVAAAVSDAHILNTDYERALEHIRQSLRAANPQTAESMLEDVARRRDLQAAEYFNLLGVLYEVQHKWRLARKCYGKAMRASKQYEPANINMRRMYELFTFGRTQYRIQLGDELEKAVNAMSATTPN